jgi:hypothetical protein
MHGKNALVVGIIAGVVIGNTKQGREAFRAVADRASKLWADDRVQDRVGDLQKQVKKVPVVGDDLSDAIDKAKPAKAS